MAGKKGMKEYSFEVRIKAVKSSFGRRQNS